jgi:intracellular septation protein
MMAPHFAPPRSPRTPMKILFDFFPILVFFVVFKLEGIMPATGAAIVATAIQVGFTYWKHRRVERLALVTLALIVVLGGLTLALQDERFIKWKPTAVNWLFAVVFLASDYIGAKNLVRRMLERSVNLPDAAWVRLNRGWVAFFAAMGAANLYVAFNFATEVWVNFKVFGILGLTLLFVLGQALYLMRHAGEVEGPRKRLTQKVINKGQR